MSELKPCPFCPRSQVSIVKWGERQYRVLCGACGEGTGICKSIKEAERAFNRLAFDKRSAKAGWLAAAHYYGRGEAKAKAQFENWWRTRE